MKKKIVSKGQTHAKDSFCLEIIEADETERGFTETLTTAHHSYFLPRIGQGQAGKAPFIFTMNSTIYLKFRDQRKKERAEQSQEDWKCTE